MATFSPTIRVAINRLKFRYPFRIAHGVRDGTDVVLIKIAVDEHYGLGEATLPPYLPWKAHDVLKLLEKTKITFELKNNQPIWNVSNDLVLECPPAAAAIDMAVWQCAASLTKQTLHDWLGQGNHQVPHTFTIGISDAAEMNDKIHFGIAHGFTHFKLKMDGQNDRQVVENYKHITHHPFAVDANQAWIEGKESNAFAKDLEQNGCLLIEQPFHRSNHPGHHALCKHLTIPVIGDESIQGWEDLQCFGSHYTGVNIKLQKCGGITPALTMLTLAKSLNHYVLIGCMSESSIGCGAGEAVALGAQMADLDGPWLISNDQEIKEHALAL
jgi:L-Ala-D/L-Glu epimerase